MEKVDGRSYDLDKIGEVQAGERQLEGSKRQHRRSYSEFCTHGGGALLVLNNYGDGAMDLQHGREDSNTESSVDMMKEDMTKEKMKKKKKKQQRAVSWDLTHDDQEVGLKRRLASYKLYHLETKIKSSLKKGCCWIKGQCDILLHNLK